MKNPQDDTSPLPMPPMAPTAPTAPAGNRAVTAAAIEQACTLLQELGSIASAAMAVSRFSTADLDGGEALDNLHGRMHALQLMVDRMGWVADVGLRTLGGQPMMARAEDWMLPGIHEIPAA